MKTIWLVALLAVPAQAQNIFLLGSNTAPPPDLNGQVPAAPMAATAPAGANVYVNVNAGPAPACTAYPAYDPYYYPQYYSPNVMYIGGPGTCGPNYSYYPNYNSGNVIYFGGLQAYRHGYNFRHCR